MEHIYTNKIKRIYNAEEKNQWYWCLDWTLKMSLNIYIIYIIKIKTIYNADENNEWYWCLDWLGKSHSIFI